MIGSLTGTVSFKRSDCFFLSVGGVGYVVYPPQRILSDFAIGQQVSVFTHTHVREDILMLFGFLTDDELRFFELLLSVSGIGPKTALSIVDRGVDLVRQAIVSSDVSFFTTVPRLGKKNAQKIIIELKSKLGSVSELDLGNVGGETEEVIDALVNLGFTKSEIIDVLRQLPKNKVTVEEKISYVFKLLGKGKG